MAIEIADLQYPLNMLIFHSYVSLPEGMYAYCLGLCKGYVREYPPQKNMAKHMVQ